MYLLSILQGVKQRTRSQIARVPDCSTQGPGTRDASIMEVKAAPRAKKPSQLGKVQGLRRMALTSSMTSSSLSAVAVPTQLGAGTETSARAARQARRDKMRETASSELSTHGQVSGQHCQQQQLQCKAADALDSMEDARVPQTGSPAKAGVATRAQAARTAQALAGQSQQPAAQQDRQTHPQGASREGPAGSPEPRVTRSSARAAQAQRRHHPYRKPSSAATSTAAHGGPAVQTRSALRRQQCVTQDANTNFSENSGPVTRRQHMLCVLKQQKSFQASEAETPASAPASDAAPSRTKVRARRPAGRQAGVDESNSTARRTCGEKPTGSIPVTAAQRAESVPSRTKRCKRARDTAEAQHAQTDLSERSGPVTRSRRLLCGGEQQRSALVTQTEPKASAPACSAAQHSMQLRAQKPTGRQTGADRTSSAARRSLRSRGPVQPELSSLTPPTPAQQAESAPSRAQRGKRSRGIAEISDPDHERPAPSSTGGGKGQSPESAEHRGLQPDVASEAPCPAKRSRLESPTGWSQLAGPEAAAPAACSASATSQSLSGAHRGRKVKKQRRLVQAQGPVPQNVPSVPQQTAIAAALQEAISALQSVLAQQAPAAAQEELDASQAPHVSPQGLGAAQEAPAPAQPAAQREQIEADALPITAAPAEEAAPTAPGVASGHAQPRKPQWPAWTLRGTLMHEDIVRQFPCAMTGRQDEMDTFFFRPEAIKFAQGMLTKRSVLRGKVDSGVNIKRYGQNWEKPFGSVLSFVSRPSDDPTISLDARIWARVKAKIIKDNGGVEPTPGHRRYDDFVEASKYSHGVPIPVEW